MKPAIHEKINLAILMGRQQLIQGEWQPLIHLVTKHTSGLQKLKLIPIIQK